MSTTSIHRLRVLFLRLGACAFTLALAGCFVIVPAFDRSAVKSDFVDSQSCPSGRVTVTSIPRPSWAKADPPPPPPSPEIAADPARAAVYYKTHKPVDPYDGVPFYQVQGCGKNFVYQCPLVPNPDGRSVSPQCGVISPPAQ